MLKVMTLNLNYYETRFGSWEDRKHLISYAIQKNNPDILAFQAVKQDPEQYDGLDQVSQLAAGLPQYPSVVFQPAYTFVDGTSDGLGFLSRFRILESDYEPLTFIPGLDDPNHRIILHGLFDLPQCPLHLFNAHLSWVKEQTAINLPEALRYAGCFKGYKALVGDLNTTPDSDLLQQFRQQGWVDAWSEIHPSQPGYTFESREPSMRIDYVWLDNELNDKIAGIEITADTPGQNNSRSSNHLGLVVSLENW